VTLAFPVSITALSLVAGYWLQRLWDAPDPAAQAGFSLLAALSALALLEHWLMVVPLPDAKLWRWMLPAQRAPFHPIPSEERPRP
jgi:putative photosynthetic complex assembly protein 2